jgi:hypothetical protein
MNANEYLDRLVLFETEEDFDDEYDRFYIWYKNEKFYFDNDGGYQPEVLGFITDISSEDQFGYHEEFEYDSADWETLYTIIFYDEANSMLICQRI